MNDFTPPAAVRDFQSLHGLMSHAASLHKEFVRHDKMNLQRALEIGRALAAARRMCQGQLGLWTTELEKAGISTQRASEWIRGSETTAATQAEWQSMRDMTRWLAENSGQQQVGTPCAGSTGGGESTNAAPWPENNRCRDCRVQGLNDPNCKACRERNKPPAPPSRPNNRSAPDPTFAENLEARAEHGPGADDGDLDEAAAALAMVLAKKVRAGIDRAAFKHCKAVAMSLGLEVTLQGEGADPKFHHPVIQQAYRKITQAKWDLCRALKQETTP